MSATVFFVTPMVAGMLIFYGGPQSALAAFCPPKFLSCPCGRTQDHIVIAVKMCDIANTNIPNCQSCDWITDFDRCSFFQNCTTCTTKPLDCQDCTRFSYNNSIRQDCSWKILYYNQRIVECLCYSTYVTNLALTPIIWLSDTSYTKTNVNENLRVCKWPRDWRSLDGSPFVAENTIMNLKCNQGYDLVGSKNVTCLPGGIWSTDFPTCVPSITKPLVPPGNNIPEDTVPPVTMTTEEPVPPVKPPKRPPGPPMHPPSTRLISRRRPRPSTLPPQAQLSTTTQPSIQILDVSADSVTQPPQPVVNPGSSDPTDQQCEPEAVQTFSCPHPFEVDGDSIVYCPPTRRWNITPPKCKLICGKRGDPHLDPLIIDGSHARINEFPWQVALTTYGAYGGYGELRYINCGGVLISDIYVVTAGHCITEDRTTNLLDTKLLQLYFGKYYPDMNLDNNDVVQRKVTRLYLHPNYDPITLDSDLGLIRLAQKVEINTVIMPLCLPNDNSMVTFEEGQIGLVAGFGETDNVGTLPTTLMKITLPIISNEKCAASYKKHNFTQSVTANMFCAGFEKGGKSACHGDSGGAMAFLENERYVLEGIVSWGSKDDCAASGLYGGYVRVRNFMPWINGFVSSP